MSRVLPVSYTHLDVYKRQVCVHDLNMRYTDCSRFAGLAHCVKVAINYVLVFSSSVLDAVSYTHLDVYKRQCIASLRLRKPLTVAEFDKNIKRDCKLLILCRDMYVIHIYPVLE